jgi:long-chain acyl-CoA synthetase
VGDSGAETLICLNVFAPLAGAIRERVPTLKRVIVSGEANLPGSERMEALMRPRMGPAPVHASRPDDLAALIYTSGTTGRPKGAMLSHANIIANGESCREIIEVTDQDVFCTVLPLFHSFGATVCMVLPILSGAHSVLVPKFSPLTVLEALSDPQITFFAGVPSMFAVMLGVKTDRVFDLSHLRVCASGGAALSVDVMFGFEERFGVHIIEGYGPTEASPVVSVNPPRGPRKPGTVGVPLPRVEVCIRDDDFRPVPTGRIGEICVKGPNVMQGYWKNLEATAQTLRDGWLLTGDMGSLDEDGYLTIADRKKDMIIVGGMNVYPREVEDVIYRLPQVAEAAVIGIPNRLRGEDVKAYISLRPESSLEALTVIDHCKHALASYKVPRSVEFRDELPKSGTGKVLKRALREPV